MGCVPSAGLPGAPRMAVTTGIHAAECSWGAATYSRDGTEHRPWAGLAAWSRHSSLAGLPWAWCAPHRRCTAAGPEAPPAGVLSPLIPSKPRGQELPLPLGTGWTLFPGPGQPTPRFPKASSEKSKKDPSVRVGTPPTGALELCSPDEGEVPSSPLRSPRPRLLRRLCSPAFVMVPLGGEDIDLRESFL